MLTSWKTIVITIIIAEVVIIKQTQQIRLSPTQNSLPNKFIFNQIQINEKTV